MVAIFTGVWSAAARRCRWTLSAAAPLGECARLAANRAGFPIPKTSRRAAALSQRGRVIEKYRAGKTHQERRNIARVLVAADEARGVVGFYSLSTFTLSFEDLPEDIARKLPRYDAIPAALIGRLARDERMRGRGIGELLLTDAIRRILGAGQTLAMFVIVVDAEDAHAAAFYGGFGFRPFPLHPSRLFLLASSAVAAVERM